MASEKSTNGDKAAATEQPKTSPEAQRAYHADYYLKHQKEISERRKKRYESDPKYRKRAQRRAMIRHKAIQKAKKEARGPIAPTNPLSHGARKYNKPRVMTIGGKPVLVRGVAEFADRICRDVQTITVWEQKQIIPPPTGTDELNRRWYSDSHIEFIRNQVVAFQASGSRRLADFGALVQKEWVKAGGSPYRR